MTKMKATKRALLSSALALFLCCAMLIGTTFAWFTDSVTSGSNIIQTGNLDIEVEYTLDGKTWNDFDGANDLFQKGSWEPGHTEVVVLKITNKGSLALKYTAQMNIIDEVVGKNNDGADIVLSDILTVSTLTQAANDIGDIALMLAYNGENSVAYENVANFKDSNVLRADQELFSGDSHYVFIKVDMAETVGNEANHDGVNIPSIEFGINIFATQYTYENDSFGNDYDAEAPLPEMITNAADLATALTANEKEIFVTISGDTDLPISSLGQQTGGSGEYKLGGEDTEKIVIDLNGHELNITTTYWSAIGAVNPDATIVIKNGSMTSSQATGTWNSYDVTFANCNYVFEDVVFEKAIALTNAEKSVTMSNVTINETHDYYALWISAKGQNVEIDGLTINSAGRGIKIDEQYVNAPAKVTLNVANADFNTAKKAAILVKSVAGADIVVNNVDIAGVAADPFNEVWVDEDAAAYADLVTVTGGEVVVEGSTDIPVMANPSNVQDCIKNAAAGATVVLTAGTYEDTIVMKSNITLLGTDGAVVNCVNLNGSENVTIKNVVFDAAGAKYGYNGSGNTVQPANIVTGTATDNPLIGAHNVLIENCTFTGAFVDGGGSIAFMDQSRSTGGSGNITIKGCTFETTGGYFDVYAFYSGDNGAFVIENNTFASVCYNPIYLGRYQSSTPVVVKGNVFETVTDFSAAAYIQSHSAGYTVSFDAADNTFNG